MNFLPVMRRFANRVQRRRTYRAAYQGALVHRLAWQTERGLHVLLWAGIAGMTFVAVQPIIMPVSPASPISSQPPQRLAVIPSLPLSLPVTEQVQAHNDSLFVLTSPPAAEPPQLGAVSERPVRTSAPDNLPVRPLPRWQLEVQSSTMAETMALHALANANRYLQTGKFELARQWLLDILGQDPHRVEALAGMLLLSKKLGDIDSEQAYLERLRQVIPDYTCHDETLLLSEVE